MPEIELIRIGASKPDSWTLGPSRSVAPTCDAVAQALARPYTDSVLCLDASFPIPDPSLLQRLLSGPCDGWHAGLRLGMEGHPRALDHVQPQWMFSAPADPTIETTSRHVSLRALLIRREVLDQLGSPDPDADTLAGAGIEAGIRWIRAGAILRHVPDLAPERATADATPSERDGFRCVARHYGRMWAGWALTRSVRQRAVSARSAYGLLRVIRDTPTAVSAYYQHPGSDAANVNRSVSVILPTIDRYAYLDPLLGQLSEQTSPPHEVRIVDQTPRTRRRTDLVSVAPDLPVHVTALENPGQSTARNLALSAASGEFVLFIDDDDEIAPDLLERHLERIPAGVDAICGGVDDATAGPPPPGFRHRRPSDVFPTNNTMLRRDSLRACGLFDPVFDHGPRADRDIGTRLHLSGAVMVYDPAVMVFHHHAPMGGLRTHGARAVTRASARRSLTERNLPSATEVYLGLRYYTDQQCREARAVHLLSVLSGGGSRARRAARFAVQLVMLPDTLRKIRSAEAAAQDLLARRPPIPTLGSGPSEWAM